MPLPDSGPREELHWRRIDLRGYQRADGFYDVEAHLVDSKTHEVTLGRGRLVRPGEPIHNMSLRLVVDENLKVMDVLASTDAAPHDICPQATDTLQCLRGLSIGPGWSRSVRELLAGRKGCTHLTELLKPLATVAFQTFWKVRKNGASPADMNTRPPKINSCYAYASHREVVRERWPMHFDGTPLQHSQAPDAGE